MYRFFIFIFVCLPIFFLEAALPYRYSVDLREVNKDQIKIILRLPDLKSEKNIFCFPAMVPGTYSVYNFGRFIHNFKVTGKNGEELPVKKLDVNRYELPDIALIDFVSYEAEDTWDTEDKNDIVFEPAGTKFDANSEFILNNHGIFGYLMGGNKLPLEIEITKPDGFYASTGLIDITQGLQKDIFRINDYHELVDSPIMYCKPDTTTIDVAGTRVLISVFSPNKKITSAFISRTLNELLNAQKNYLGGKLPVDKYADRKSTRLNSSHIPLSRMPSSA